MNWRMLWTILAVCAISSVASGEVPRLISYQGFLMESPTGPPLQGQYDIVFQIYAASSGGTALWTESHTAVPVNRGVFSVNLGALQPLSNSLFADGERWLNVHVPNIATGIPRTRITSGVWALRASVADTALVCTGAAPFHTHQMSELGDVSDTTALAGEVLTWDGALWTPAPPQAGPSAPRMYGKLRMPAVDFPLTGVGTVESKDFVAPCDGYVVFSFSFNSTMSTGSGWTCNTGRNVDYWVRLNGGPPLSALGGVIETHNVGETPIPSTKGCRGQLTFPVRAGANTIAVIGQVWCHPTGGCAVLCHTHTTSEAGLWIAFYPDNPGDFELIE